MPNEFEKLFEGLSDGQKHDAFPQGDAPVGPQASAIEEPEVPSEKGPRKNRRHRRLEDELERERQSNIALNNRILELSRGNRTEGPGEPPAAWIAQWGDSPESRASWNLQKEILEDYGRKVKEETINEFREEQARAAEEQARLESLIDTNLEDVEDEFGVDLTSGSPAAKKARKEFLEEVKRMSPKDENGDIVAFADFTSVYESYKDRKAKTAAPDNARQKEISSRSMVQPGQTAPVQRQRTSGWNGWRTDLGVD